MTVQITRIIQTGYGCPTQWDAVDAEGQRYYIRFRFGQLTVTAITAGENGTQVFHANHGDELDGVLGFPQLRELTAGRFDFAAAEHTDEALL